MKSWSLASRIVASVLVVVVGALTVLSLLLASFTRFEVTERLDNSLQEVAERLEFVVSDIERQGSGQQGSGQPGDASGQEAAIVARLPHVDRRTLAYQIATRDGHLGLRSQNAPDHLFDVPLTAGFYDRQDFRVYVTPSQSGRHVILVGEPVFHRQEAVQRAVLISVLPTLIFLPVIWLLVNWIVRRSLRSMEQLQTEIRTRSGSNLSPVPPLDLPPELLTIHTAVNSLLERLTMALATERAFAANAAHELRNPIASLMAQAQLLRARLIETSDFESADTIVRQARRIARTTEKLLQLSRAASGVALQGQAVSLRSLIRLLSDEMNQSSRLVFTEEGTSPGPVRGDVDAVGILLRNLLENALSHSPPGSPVRIVLRRGSEILIENDCPAIDPSLLTRLREPFVRGETDSEGSGLGLAIVTGIAQQSGAKMAFHSPVPGTSRGVQVIVGFPPGPTAAGETVRTDATPAKPDYGTEKGRDQPHPA